MAEPMRLAVPASPVGEFSGSRALGHCLHVHSHLPRSSPLCRVIIAPSLPLFRVGKRRVTVSFVIMSRGEGRNLGYIRADQEDSTVKSLENSRREEVDEWNAWLGYRRPIELISIDVSLGVLLEIF